MAESVEEQFDKKTIHISVRSLVEFILRSGDIDNRVGAGVQKEAMLAGSRMHRKIQKKMGASYDSEVVLKTLADMGRYFISIEGRADGIITKRDVDGNETEVIIDEIKTMYSDVTKMNAPVPVHRAQAMCYAAIYLEKYPMEEIAVQLTYVNLDTEEIKRFQERFCAEYLKDWMHGLLDEYRKWTDRDFEWKRIRQQSIHELEFPFAYRKGQKKLTADVYRTIARGKILFLQAPTGTGKTISTIFPAVKAVGEEIGDKIFYLTAKTVTGRAAADAVHLLKKHGYRGKVIQLTAREKICLNNGNADCNPDACPYAKGHFDRVNDAVFDLLQNCDDYDAGVLTAQAEKYTVCPYDMSLDLAVWCDMILCDYNYVFDPNVRLKRFFGEGESGSYIFLIDEAHNLVDRGRSMYSACLVKEDFLQVRRLLKQDRKINRALSVCNTQMLEWKRECEEWNELNSIGAFQFQLLHLYSLLEDWLHNHPEYPDREIVLDFFLQLRHFLNMSELLDEHYMIYTDYNMNGSFRVHLFCVNPAANLQNCLDQAVSSILFSATLLPIHYYKNLLSIREDNYAVYAETIFSQDQRLLVIAGDVSSAYRRRGEDEFKKIASYLLETVRAQKGNYMAFFPSYRMMEDVLAVFETIAGSQQDHVECVVQSRRMTEDEREHFLVRFSEQHEGSLLGFCVLGGIFAEGIDLKKEGLIGAVIVGTGLPQICTEREVLRTYYDRTMGQGFDYAYLFPGMNKVLQAAGRVIRTADDRGVIELLDERFLRREYRSLFPREWEQHEVIRFHQLSSVLQRFWESEKSADDFSPE